MLSLKKSKMLKLFNKQRILERLKTKEKKEENPYLSCKIYEKESVLVKKIT